MPHFEREKMPQSTNSLSIKIKIIQFHFHAIKKKKNNYHIKLLSFFLLTF